LGLAKKKFKAEEVSVSFHSLYREEKSDGEAQKVKFSLEEFDGIFEALSNQQGVDLNDEESSDRVRYRLVAPISKIERHNQRIICGQYKAAYWGHSYENSIKGDIPSDSINLRPFFFLLYLGDNGRIYVASQYLGYFGGYTALRNTILSTLPKPSSITAVSFNIGGTSYEGLQPREIQITYSKKEKTITGRPKVNKAGVIVFKKQGKDDPFGEQVKERLFTKTNKSDIKKAVRALANASELFELKDEDIDDCKVIALKDGKRRTVFLLDGSNYATKFPLSVKLEEDGHPVYEEVKPKVISVLTNRVLTLQKNE